MPTSRPISLPELDALLAVLAHPRNQAIVLLACATGARVAELCSARIDQVMRPDYTLSGVLSLPRRAVKGKKRARTQLIAHRALRALDAWIQVHPSPLPASPLFPALRPPLRPLTTRQVQRIISAAADAAGLAGNVSPHSLRKLYGVQVYGHTDRDIAITADLLGHRSPQSTMHYLDLDGETRRAAALAVFCPTTSTPTGGNHGEGTVDLAS